MDLIYDWNDESDERPDFGHVEVDDETLRDGLQSPSVHEPEFDRKIAILDAMNSLGIRPGDIGLPPAQCCQNRFQTNGLGV